MDPSTGCLTTHDQKDSLTHWANSQSSTASISSSILQYRAINGRTYHSARHATEYFAPNDQQQQESLDLA